MSAVTGSPRVLHIHGSLDAGDAQAERCARVIDAFGGRLRHTLVSGNGEWGALDSVAKGVPLDRLADFPALSGLPLPGRFQKIAQAMVDYHLVLTYGWGGIDAALAHTLFSQHLRLPPLIHHEDGSDETPDERRGLRSSWYRRVGLGKAAGLVVPTELMEGEALVRWQQPFGRVKTIRDGVDLDRFGKPPKNAAIPRLLKRPGERWIGCAVCFEPGEGLDALLAALTGIDPAWHLVLAGDGPARGALEARVSELSLEDRVHVVARVDDPAVLTMLSDIVAIASGPQALPQAALMAMAAGKPVAGFDTGELATALALDNAPFIAAPGDAAGLAAAVQRLAGDEYLRKRAGEANRERAVAERDAKAMVAAYRRLYASAMKRETI